jgi:hypothetical protein
MILFAQVKSKSLFKEVGFQVEVSPGKTFVRKEAWVRDGGIYLKGGLALLTVFPGFKSP